MEGAGRAKSRKRMSAKRLRSSMKRLSVGRQKRGDSRAFSIKRTQEATTESSKVDRLMKVSQEIISELSDIRSHFKAMDGEVKLTMKTISQEINLKDPPGTAKKGKEIKQLLKRQKAKLKTLWESTNVFMKEIKQSYHDIAETVRFDPDTAEEHLNQIKDSMANVRNFYKMYETEASKFLAKYDNILDEVDSIESSYYGGLTMNRKSKMRAAIRTENEAQALAMADRFAAQLNATIEATGDVGVIDKTSETEKVRYHKSNDHRQKKKKKQGYIFTKFFKSSKGTTKETGENEVTDMTPPTDSGRVSDKITNMSLSKNRTKDLDISQLKPLSSPFLDKVDPEPIYESLSKKALAWKPDLTTATITPRTKRAAVVAGGGSKAKDKGADDSKQCCLACGLFIDLSKLKSSEKYADSQGNYYHKSCLKCSTCQKNLGSGNFFKVNDPNAVSAHLGPNKNMVKIYCSSHYDVVRSPRVSNFADRPSKKPEIRTLTYKRPDIPKKSLPPQSFHPKPQKPLYAENTTDASVDSDEPQEKTNAPDSSEKTVETKLASDVNNQVEPKDSQIPTTRTKRKSVSRVGRAATEAANIKPCMVCHRHINLISTPAFERYRDSNQNHYHKACLRCEVCNISLGSSFQKLQTGDKLRILCNRHFISLKQSLASKGIDVKDNQTKSVSPPSNDTKSTDDQDTVTHSSPKANKIENSQSEAPASKLLVRRQKKRASVSRLSIGRAATDSTNIKPCEICQKHINLISTPVYERYKDNNQKHYHKECLRCEVCKQYLGGDFQTLKTGDRLRYLCQSHFSQLKQFSTGIEVTKGTDKESMEHRESVTRGRHSITRGHLKRAKDEIGDDLELMFDKMTPLCLKCGLELDSSNILIVASHGRAQAHAECPSPEAVAQNKLGNIRLIVRKLPKDIPVKFHFNNQQVRTYFFHLDPETFGVALKQGQKENAVVKYFAETEEDVKKRRSMKRPIRYAAEDGVSPAFRAELRGDLARVSKGSMLETFYVRAKNEVEEALTAKGTLEQGLLYSVSATVSHNLKNGYVFPTHLELEISRADI